MGLDKPPRFWYTGLMSNKTTTVKTPKSATKARKTPLSAAIAAADMALQRATFRKNVSYTRADTIVKVANLKAESLRTDAKQYDALITTLTENLSALRTMENTISKMGFAS